MDIDRIAREAAAALKQSADAVDRPSLAGLRTVRRRRSRLVAVAAGFAVTLLIAGVALMFREPGGPGTPAAPPATDPAPQSVDEARSVDGSIVHSDPEFLFTVTYPEDWFRAEESLTGFRDPFEVLSMATFLLDREQGSCGPFPARAVVDFPADAAFITLRETVSGIASGEFVTRPAAFDPQSEPLVLPEGDCLDNTPRGDIGVMRWFAFEDAGRSFELLVVIGDAASAAVADEAWAIVNSLSFDPRPPLDAPPALEASLSGNVFVLDPGDGPVVCAGGVATSLPPRCSGPALDGLDWDDVPWAETAQGQRWAGMYIEVRLREGRLELQRPPEVTRPTEFERTDFTPPCPEPDGGWVFPAGPGTSEDDLNAAFAYIQSQADQSGAWVFNLDETPSDFEPLQHVIVATFTGDIARHEMALREIWSGPLCVAERPWTERDLRAIQDELVALNVTDLPGGIFLPSSFGVDVTEGAVEVEAMVVTPEGQQWLDDRYGPEVVRASGALRPLPVKTQAE